MTIQSLFVVQMTILELLTNMMMNLSIVLSTFVFWPHWSRKLSNEGVEMECLDLSPLLAQLFVSAT